jgi:RimJ/RimL family protein N-acetyltransferase
MLTFATAEEASLVAFLSVSEKSPHQPHLREYLESLLRQECTRPGWCVIGYRAGAPVARAAFWALPGRPVPTDLVLIDADRDEADLSAGRALLARMHELATELAAEELSHSVDSPPQAPQYQENEDARIRLLEESGYELLRDGLRWRYSGSPTRDDGSVQSLVLRALPEVGEGAFVDAMAATYQGTRDSWITRTIEERGRREAARADFLDYQALEHRPEWWELAYTEDGALAGVIMAAKNPSTAVIGYVGVVPEQRGRGFATQLVRRGTEQLHAGGAAAIGGDCDRDNVGMVKALERAGYAQVARRRTYHRATRGSTRPS